MIDRDMDVCKNPKTLMEAKDIVAGYDKRVVVDHVNFQIKEGQFIALLGRNGCGKTTLIKSIAGLHQMYSGEIFFHNISSETFKKKEFAKYVAYLPQRRDLFYNMLSEEMVVLGVNPSLGDFEVPNAKHKAKAIQVMEEIGIRHLIGRGYLDLSEGEKQMVLLARTIIQDAAVFLFDEPDGALDFVNRYEVLDHIRNWIIKNKRGGLAILHDPNLALACCDTIIVVVDGRIVEEIVVAEATALEIETALKRIYGEIEIIQHKQKFIMIRDKNNGSQN